MIILRRGIVPPAGSGLASPALVQGLFSAPAHASNPLGNNFKYEMPNPVLAGNCLVVALVYPNGVTATISDNNGNSWPGSPAVTADAGAGNLVAAIFVLPNANAGNTLMTVALSTTVQDFEWHITEWSNIATVSPVNGTHSANTVTAPNLAAGSFTPTVNNDVAGGNLIYSFFASTAEIVVASNPPSLWTPGASHQLLHADIQTRGSGTGTLGVPNASQYLVQKVQAAINPSMTLTGDSANTYNCVAVALKAANAGTPRPTTGVRILKLHHQTAEVPPGPYTLQFPFMGDFRAIIAVNLASPVEVSSIDDTQNGANSWTVVPGLNDIANMRQFYQFNKAPTSNTNTVTIHYTNPPGTGRTYRVYDIIGARTSSPIGATGATSQVNDNNGGGLRWQPVLNPKQPNSIILSYSDLGFGPTFIPAVGPPGSHCILDTVNYTNQVDTDTMDNADAAAHLNLSSTMGNNVAIPKVWFDFTWAEPSPGNNGSGQQAFEVMAALAAGQPDLAPVSATASGTTTASLSVSTTVGNGTLYWIVSTSATPPTPAQIKAGQDSSGSTAAAHGSQAVSASGTQSASATGLTAGTYYYAYFLQRSATPADSWVYLSQRFTTNAAAAAIYSQTLSTDIPAGSGPNGVSTRNVCTITGGAGGGGQVRVTFQASTASGGATGWFVNNASIGISNGTGANTTATPVELLFNGAHGFALLPGESVTSDWASLSGFTASNLLVTVTDASLVPEGSFPAEAAPTGTTAWTLGMSGTAPAVSYNLATVTGFTSTATFVIGTAKIEVQ